MGGDVLAGIKVLDLSRVLAGPWCAMSLADLGAEVIKIENPRGGDDTRAYRPPDIDGESAYFLSCNRSKRSLALDFSKVEGQEIVRELAKQADVLVENYRYGTLKRYGLDYDDLCDDNPGLIYCSISGYGRVGQKRENAGYDSVIQAEGGLISVTGEADGPAVKVGVSIADLLSGMNATQAVLAALIARGKTGRGQQIDISLLDGVVSVLANLGASYFMNNTPPKRWGTEHPQLVPCQAFDASDGQFVVVIGNDRQFQSLCEVIQREDIGEDTRYTTNADRINNRETLIPALNDTFKRRTRQEWLKRIHTAGLPAGSIRDVGEVLNAPEVIERGMVATIDHPYGEIKLVNSPLRFSESSLQEPFAPPLLGQHSQQVLRNELNYTEEQISLLEKAGIVAQHDWSRT